MRCEQRAARRNDWLGFGHGDIDFSRVHVGDKLWKTSDPELDRRLRQSFAGDKPQFQRPIDMEVHGGVGKPLTLIARDEQGHVAQVDSAMPLADGGKAAADARSDCANNWVASAARRSNWAN